MDRRRLGVALIALATLATAWAPPLWRVHVVATNDAPSVSRPSVAGVELALLGGSVLVTWTAETLGR